MPLGAYVVTQNSAKMRQKLHFHTKMRKFPGRWHSHVPDPFLVEMGHPFQYITP